MPPVRRVKAPTEGITAVMPSSVLWRRIGRSRGRRQLPSSFREAAAALVVSPHTVQSTSSTSSRSSTFAREAQPSPESSGKTRPNPEVNPQEETAWRCSARLQLRVPAAFTPVVSRKGGADPCGAPAFWPRRGTRGRDSEREAREAADCARTPPRGAASIAARASGCPGS